MKAWTTVIRHYYKSGSQTFNASSSFQTYTVPAGVTSVSVDCVASKGANYQFMGVVATGGLGGRVRCTLSTTPGETLYVMVGSIPSAHNVVAYNASDIRTNNSGVVDTTSLNSRLVVAGGGGNGLLYISGQTLLGNGGDGGGTTGGNGAYSGSSYGGIGGTQSAGGHYNGALGTGGCYGVTQGALGTGDSSHAAGGCGYYGGGGTANYQSAGGGGGSSYADSTRCSGVTHTQGYRDGTGYITISYTVESTESDYDYYVDEISYKIKNNNGVYKAVKSWKKGQYYGN